MAVDFDDPLNDPLAPPAGLGAGSGSGSGGGSGGGGGAEAASKGDAHDALAAPGVTFTTAAPMYDVVGEGGASKVRFSVDQAATEQLRRLVSAPPGMHNVERARDMCAKAMFEAGERGKRAAKNVDPFAESEVDTSLNDSTDPGYLRRWAQFLREAAAQGWDGGRGMPGMAPPVGEEYKVEYYVVEEQECINAKKVL